MTAKENSKVDVLVKDKPSKKIFKSKKWGNFFDVLQKIGKSLLFPIAVLPIAALMMRIGALIESETIAGSVGHWIGTIIRVPGSAAFDNLAALFAIGVGFGFAKDSRGEAALVSFFSWLILHMFVDTAGTGIPSLIYDSVNSGSLAAVDPVTDLAYVDASGNTVSSLVYVIKPSADGLTNTVAYNVNTGVAGGITAGLLTAAFYNKYSNIELPSALSFFSGRRFLPMIMAFVMIPVSFIAAVFWPWIQLALYELGSAVATSGLDWVASGVYALLNRLLLPFGLHHVLNTFFWFQIPVVGVATDITVSSGMAKHVGEQVTIYGDINAYTNGLVNSGTFQSGYFPIMMFGLPAIGLAIVARGDKDNRKALMGVIGGAALIAFITGVTEPLEFTFAFIAPGMYVLYSVMSAIAAAITVALGQTIGFGFSAGLIDYAVSIPTTMQMIDVSNQVNAGTMPIVDASGTLISNPVSVNEISNPGWMMLIGAVTGVIYFFTFYWFIGYFKVKTPGRLGMPVGVQNSKVIASDDNSPGSETSKFSGEAEQILKYVGGYENVKTIDNCATRLRLTLVDNKKVEKLKIKEEGLAVDAITIGDSAAQIIIGPKVELVTDAFRKIYDRDKSNSSKKKVTENTEAEKTLTEKKATEKKATEKKVTEKKATEKKATEKKDTKKKATEKKDTEKK